MHLVAAQPARWVEVGVLVAAIPLATGGRFLVMRGWTDRPRRA